MLDHCGRALSQLTQDGREAADEALASTIAGLLELDLGDLLIYAWRTHHRLVDAAEATLAAPGRQEIVQLGSHQVTLAHNPTIDLLVDGVRVHTFRFRLTVVFDVDVAAAVIQDGRLVAVKAGKSTLTASLTLAMPGGDVQLVRRQHRIDLHLIIHLDHGVPLLRSRDPARLRP